MTYLAVTNQWSTLSRQLAHGLCGGVVSPTRGDSIEAGFLAGFGGGYFAGTSTTAFIGAAIVGGTVSAIGGGKFCEWSDTGAFASLARILHERAFAGGLIGHPDGSRVLHEKLESFLPHSGASRAFQAQLPLPPWFIHVPGQHGLGVRRSPAATPPCGTGPGGGRRGSSRGGYAGYCGSPRPRLSAARAEYWPRRRCAPP